MPFSCKDDVTYEAFGIDPAAFYATKFSYGSAWNPAAITPGVEQGLGFDKFKTLERALADLLKTAERVRCLDVGCGSGIYGRWLKHRFGDQIHLTGADMSEACIADAISGGYDDAQVCDFVTSMPFPDAAFDFVFSMDVMGHVEFRSKDVAFAEMFRVTAPGGAHLHGVETADVPYLPSNAADPFDEVRKYVWIDGHVGVETLDCLVERASRFFVVEEAYPWLLRPFLEASNVVNCRQWPELQSALQEHDSVQSRAFADLFSQHYNEVFRKMLREAVGPVQTTEAIERSVGTGATGKLLLDLCAGSGFSMVLLRRPMLQA